MRNHRHKVILEFSYFLFFAESDLKFFSQNLVNELQPTTAANQNLIFTAQGDLENIPIDAELLQHVLTNLLSNAIKYSPAGEDIIFNLTRLDDQVLFQIKDHGIGIPEEDQKQLFEPYHRAQNVGIISGTGLGLKITKDCVDLHGGRIEVKSIEGEGSRFSVYLPVGIRNKNVYKELVTEP